MPHFPPSRATLVLTCVVIAFGSSGCTGSSPRRVAAEGTWSAAPPMAHARAAHAVVSTRQAIYALAGTEQGRAPVLEVERFDGNAWSVETSLPGDGLNAPAAVMLGGRIILIGGFSTVSNVPVADVRAYDLATRAWSELPPMPAPRGGHAAVVLDGTIHVVGGGNSVSTLSDHLVYDPASNAWAPLAPLPRSEGSPAAVLFEGRLHVIGGRSGPMDFGDVYLYDAPADRWTSGPPIPPRGTAGAVAYRGSVWLFGGESQAEHRCLADVLRLGSGAVEWRAAAPMPTARNFARAVLLGDAVNVVGGSPEPDSSHASLGSALVERFSLSPDR